MLYTLSIILFYFILFIGSSAFYHAIEAMAMHGFSPFHTYHCLFNFLLFLSLNHIIISY